MCLCAASNLQRCGDTKLWTPAERFLVSVLAWVSWLSLCVSVWLLVKCMPCILITPQRCERLSSNGSNNSNISEQCVEKWTVRVWTSKQKHLPKDSVVKKIQREKKQHRHDITIGPEVAQRSWNTLNNTAAPRKRHGSSFFLTLTVFYRFFLLSHDNTWKLIFIYTIYTIFADNMKQGV